MHSEHIGIEDGIFIFDCIEFNRRFRYCDVVSDAAFLSMDLEFRGRADLAKAFEERYFSATGDIEGKGCWIFTNVTAPLCGARSRVSNLKRARNLPKIKRRPFESPSLFRPFLRILYRRT